MELGFRKRGLHSGDSVEAAINYQEGRDWVALGSKGYLKIMLPRNRDWTVLLWMVYGFGCYLLLLINMLTQRAKGQNIVRFGHRMATGRKGLKESNQVKFCGKLLELSCENASVMQECGALVMEW